MSKIHYFITTFARNDLTLSISDEKVIHQAHNVLRLEKGENLYIGDGKNIRYETKITELTKKNLICEILNEELAQEALPEIFIALATIKKEAFEYALEKMTEVGVHGILPIASDRVIKKGVNIERSRIILREASEQSGRIIVPQLLPEMDLQRAFEYYIKKIEGSESVQLVFCEIPNTDSPSKVQAKELVIPNPQTIIFFIGPEGGWSDREKLSADLLGIPKYNLGGNVLRAETAAIVMGYLAVNNKL